MRKTRIFALALAIILLLCITAAGAFIAHEADHECSGDNCPICAAVAAWTGTLQLLGFAAAIFPALCSVLRRAVRRGALLPDLFSLKTPVSLKVLLLN